MCGHYVTVNFQKPAIIFHLKPCRAEYFFILYTLSQYIKHVSSGPWREKTCLRGLANNKGIDQSALPRTLISAFVIHLLESIGTYLDLLRGKFQFSS